MSGAALHLLVPGPLDQRTGGYRYDARIAAGLRRLGWTVTVHELEGSFPGPDAAASSALDAALSGLPDGARVVADGLALGGHPEPARAHADRLRLVGLVHHPLAEETGLAPEARETLAAAERRALAACRGVITTSRFTARRVREMGVGGGRVRAVRPGTDPAPAAVGPGPGSPPRLLTVGAVVPRKGHDVLVRALERLRDVPWTWVCAGSLRREPVHASAVRARAREGGLAERIRFTGEVGPDRLARLYHRSTLFVLPSRYEGYGMALAEALARGLPIVSTTAAAIPETVPAEAAVLVPPDDAGALADALAGLVGSAPEGRSGRSSGGAGRLDELAAAARRHGRTLPDWERASRAFASAVAELTGGASAG